jgi:flagellar biosynthesis/type III secretory pathway protein FliH
MVRKMPEGMPLSAYIHMLLQANSKGLREMRAMSDTSLEAVLEELGFTAEWEARGLERGWEEFLQKSLERGLQKGLERGLQKGREEAVRRLQKYGMDPKQISEALELPLGTVFRYLKAE